MHNRAMRTGDTILAVGCYAQHAICSHPYVTAGLKLLILENQTFEPIEGLKLFLDSYRIYIYMITSICLC